MINYPQDGMLRIEGVKLKQDTGTYRCVGENDYGQASGTIYVYG